MNIIGGEKLELSALLEMRLTPQGQRVVERRGWAGLAISAPVQMTLAQFISIFGRDMTDGKGAELFEGGCVYRIERTPGEGGP